MTRGFLFIAVGPRYREMMRRVLPQLPDLPVACVTDEAIDGTIPIKAPHATGYALKPLSWPLSPFDQTCYIDADVWINRPQDLLSGFRVLDYAEVACPHAEFRGHYLRQQKPFGRAMPQLHTGLVYFDKDFPFDAYIRKYKKGPDQHVFAPFLYKQERRVWILPPEFCARPGRCYVPDRIVLVHDRTIKWPLDVRQWARRQIRRHVRKCFVN